MCQKAASATRLPPGGAQIVRPRPSSKRKFETARSRLRGQFTSLAQTKGLPRLHFKLAFLKCKRKIPPPDMDTEATESADLFRLMAWAHENQKRLKLILGTVVVVGAAVSLYIWNANRHETKASEALSEVRPAAVAAGEAK